jgi:hypothetical protein
LSLNPFWQQKRLDGSTFFRPIAQFHQKKMLAAVHTVSIAGTGFIYFVLPVPALIKKGSETFTLPMPV